MPPNGGPTETITQSYIIKRPNLHLLRDNSRAQNFASEQYIKLYTRAS